MDHTADTELISRKDREYHIIEEYGKDILSSIEFQRIVGQRHHIFSTVGYHSVHVAQKMLFLSRLFRMNERDAVRGSLWHDVGIYDRASFKGTSGTTSEHPIRSLKAAESSGTLDDTQSDMIAHHMWPVTHGLPKTREGFMITLADKWCAITEFLNFHDDRIDAVLGQAFGEADALNR